MGRADVLRTIRDAEADAKATLEKAEREASNPVSYTHLTLPTKA